MKLIVLAPLPAKYKLRYVVEVQFMYGDGDHYKTLEFDSDNEKDTISLIEICQKFVGKNPRKLDFQNWSDPPDGPYLFENWPYQEDADCPAELSEYKVLFYDINGQKCPVKVSK